MECPKCKGIEFIIYDYEPLHTIYGSNIVNDGNGNRNIADEDKYLDNELYAELKCTECGHVFKAKGKIKFELQT